MLTAAQKAALESGYQLTRAVDAFTAYVEAHVDPDDVLSALLNLLAHARGRFDDDYEEAYREHEVEEAARSAAVQP